MPTPICQAKPVCVQLDRERTVTFDTRAEFRMGSLERPFAVCDLNNRRRAWAALVAWTWACLVDQDASDFPTPEALAPHLKEPAAIDSAFAAFLETYSAAQPSDSKNTAG